MGTALAASIIKLSFPDLRAQGARTKIV